MVDEDATPVAFIGITETWWRCYTTEAQVQIPGYNLARCDRYGRVGGGCALYAHESLTISDQMEFADRDNNLTAVYIGNRHTVAAVVYRAGTNVEGFQKLLDRLQVFIDYHSQETTVPDIWLMGDFNLPLFRWKDGIPDHVDQPMHNALRGFLDTNLLSQMVTVPTRGENVLDLILTNRANYVSSITAEDLGLSDHKVVTCTLSYNCVENLASGNRQMKEFASLNLLNADWERMNHLLGEVDWDLMPDGRSLLHDYGSRGVVFGTLTPHRSPSRYIVYGAKTHEEKVEGQGSEAPSEPSPKAQSEDSGGHRSTKGES